MKKFVMVLSIFAMAAFAPLARADYSISVNGSTCGSGSGSPTTPVFGEGGGCSNFVTANGIAVSGLSTAGTQAATNSQQFTTTTFLTNTTGSAQQITIRAATNDFTNPNTPPSIMDSFTYTLNETVGAVTASSYTACVDENNGLTAPTGSNCGTPSALVISGAVSNASSTGQILIASLTGSFSLNQEVVLTLAAGTSVTVTLSQTLTQVPEPASMVLLGTMLLGVTGLVRRRAAKRS